MKIAVIGSGITGLTVALSLQEKFDLTLFEKEPRVGGHSNTIDIELEEGKVSVDSGFIVFNNKKIMLDLVIYFRFLGISSLIPYL